MYKPTMTLKEIINLIRLQGEEFFITHHSSRKTGKIWNCVKLKNGVLYAKQQSRKNGGGDYFLCNDFERTAGLINSRI